MNQFVYEGIDLEDHSFRLLRLFAGKGERIRCGLFEAKCYDEDAIEYEALSYTWGGKEKPYEIDVNNQTMPVTENLSLALRHLRHRYEDRILWIDAICIDQDNQKERGHQVRQMSSIYKKAERVIIWLGKATRETHLLFRYMSQFQKETLKYPCNNWMTSDTRWGKIWASIQPLSDSGHCKRQQQEGFSTLLNRPWFKRVWIIQEIFNARSADIMCGTGLVSSRIFSLMPSLMEVVPHPHCQAIIEIMPGPSREHSWWSQGQSLHTLLLKFKQSEASDPKDTVYALLGIAAENSNNELPEPDYEMPLEEVIDKTVVYLLRLRAQAGLSHSLNWTLPEFLDNLEALASAVFTVAAGKGYHIWVEDLMHVNVVDENELLLDKDADASVHGGLDANTLCLTSAEDHGQLTAPLPVKNTKADVDSGLHYGMALRAASAGGREQVVKVLLERIGDIDSKGVFYYTSALREASSRGHEQTSRMLLKRIANFNVRKGQLRGALRAAFAGDPDRIMKLLLNKKALQEALWAASRDGDEELVKVVLDMGVDVNAKNETYDSATRASSFRRHEHIVAMLLSNKADTTQHVQAYGSALQAASARGHEHIVTLLLRNNANINAKGGSYGSALQVASAEGHEHIVALLLKNNANINANGGIYGSALQAASARGHEHIVALLLRNNANVNAQGGTYGSALQAASAKGHKYIVMLLLRHDAQLNVLGGSYGSTLQAAPAEDHKRTVTLLLKNDFKVSGQG